ncbi:MAG: hypothetical protein N3E43_00030 [Sulfolobales archaeon]|nr:hypothetical protein [Sulfolobales archaeon]
MVRSESLVKSAGLALVRQRVIECGILLISLNKLGESAEVN